MASDNKKTSVPEVTYNATAGWQTIPEFLSGDEVEEVLTICRRLLQLPADQLLAGDKPFAGTHHLVELGKRSDLIDELVGRPHLVGIVTAILGAGFRRDQVSYRSPQPSFGGQYLHADDVPKLVPGADTVATAIVALADFTENNGSTRLVPGSHLRPDLQRQAGSLTEHPNQIQLTGPAGTAFVFSGHVLHSGTTNKSNSERPALQLVWRAHSSERPSV